MYAPFSTSVKMGARKKKRFPSQIRYDQKHPSVGVRLPRKEYDQVCRTAERLGKSVSEVIRDALLRRVSGEHRSWDMGHARGYEDAKRDYRVWFRCSRCGREITVRPCSEGHKTLIELMREARMAHVECPGSTS